MFVQIRKYILKNNIFELAAYKFIKLTKVYKFASRIYF